MANYTAPLTGGIYPEQLYKVIGTSGTVTYNAVVYAIGQEFYGVVGQRNYTRTGDALAQPIASFEELVIEMGLGQDEKAIMQTASLDNIYIETVLNQDEKEFNQLLEVNSVWLETLEPVGTTMATKYDRLIRFDENYTNGDIVGPVVLNGGTLVGTRVNVDTPGQYTTTIKAIAPAIGTVSSKLNGTVATRPIEWNTDINDASVLVNLKQIQVQIIKETSTTFRFRVTTLDTDTVDLLLETGMTEHLNETGLAGGVINRTVNGSFTTSTVLTVTGHSTLGTQYITFNLKP